MAFPNENALLIGISSTASENEIEQAFGHGMHCYLKATNDVGLLHWILELRKKIDSSMAIPSYMEQYFAIISNALSNQFDVESNPNPNALVVGDKSPDKNNPNNQGKEDTLMQEEQKESNKPADVEKAASNKPNDIDINGVAYLIPMPPGIRKSFLGSLRLKFSKSVKVQPI